MRFPWKTVCMDNHAWRPVLPTPVLAMVLLTAIIGYRGGGGWIGESPIFPPLCMKPCIMVGHICRRNLEHFDSSHIAKVRSCDSDCTSNAGELIVKIPKEVNSAVGCGMFYMCIHSAVCCGMCLHFDIPLCTVYPNLDRLAGTSIIRLQLFIEFFNGWTPRFRCALIRCIAIIPEEVGHTS